MYLDDLSHKIWFTKKSRFLSAKRIKRRRYGSYAILSLFSVFIIGINLLVFLSKFKLKSTEITILTIILSILILVVNMLIIQANYLNREEEYLKCGKELDTLNQKLQIEKEGNKEVSKDDQLKWVRDYNFILDKYKENHTYLDYKYAKCNDEYENNKNKWYKKKILFFNKYCAEAKWYLIDVNVLIIFIGIIISYITYRVLTQS